MHNPTKARPLPTRFLGCLLLALASWLTASSASAALLLLPHAPASPALTFAPPSTVVYNYGTTLYMESASPVAIQTNGTDINTLHYINPTGNPPTETFSILISVDNNGNLIGGYGGDDLKVTGEVDLDGDGVVDTAGTLLTGEIIQFGYKNSSLPFADSFDFRFRITGGLLVDRGIYRLGQDDLYVYVTSEQSSFNGNFTTGFTGQAKGSVWATPTTAIGDTVWLDANGNGIQDAGETGLASVPVQLLTCAGSPVASTTTDANGHYLFSGLLPGSYKVQVTAPTGYLFSPQDQGSDDTIDSDTDGTGLTACTTLASGQTDTTWDAGLYPPASIGDRVWLDANGNGIQDSTETGISGLTVNLNQGGATVATTTTGPDGQYGFSNLASGQYTVCVLPTSDYLETYDLDGLATPNCATLTVAPGDNRTDVDFGYLLSSPALTVVKKTNGVDAPTGTGPYLQVGAPVHWDYLLTNTGNVPLSGISVTDSMGVAVTCPQDTTLAVGAGMTCVGDGTATAGQYENLATATGRDQNNNPASSQYVSHYYGLQVTGCTYTQGYWKNHTNVWPASSLILGSGSYTSNQLLAILNTPVKGNGLISLAHQLIAAKFNLLHGASAPPAVQDAIAIADGLIGASLVPPVGGGFLDPSTTATVEGTLDAYNNGQSDLGPGHCSDQPPATCVGGIGDLVWNDANGNGLQDGGEPGIGGVTVSLSGADAYGRPVASSFVTDTTGAYMFSGLCAGSYTITASTPAGLLATSPLSANGNDGQTTDSNNPAGTAVTLASDATNNVSVDFGFTSPRPAIGIKKYTNGQAAPIVPGPEIVVGAPVNWTYVVTNTGNVELAGLAVNDDKGPAVSCPQATLPPGQTMTCTASGVAVMGQYQNVGTVTASYNGAAYTASDTSHYLGIKPAIDVTKMVSVNGGTTWLDANSPNGADVPNAAACGDSGSPSEGQCAGGVTSLTLAYQGSDPALVSVKDSAGQILYTGTVNPGQSFVVASAGQAISGPVLLYVNGHYATSIKTDCSQPIGPGYVRGDFAVISGTSLTGGTLTAVTCEEQTPAPCSACSGRVNELTMEYEGPAAYVRVLDKDNRELESNTYMRPGQRFTFMGKDFDGTMTDEVRIYVNNTYNCRLDTSSSQPIGPGHMRGWFKVVAGKSSVGGELCPVSKDDTGYNLPEPTCIYTPSGTNTCTPDKVRYKITVANTGNVPLSSLTLTDSPDGIGNCVVPATLAANSSFECQVGPLDAQAGIHTDTATATGTYNGTTVSDSDSASYNGQTPSCGLTVTKTANRTEVPKPVFANGSCFGTDGYDKDGYDVSGHDKDGYDRDGFDSSNHCRQGHSKAEHESYGYDHEGYDLDGYDREGYDRNGFDRHGYDRDGFNKTGFNREGRCREGHSQAYHQLKGCDVSGYDLDGYDASGYNKSGYDREGWDKTDHDRLGNDKEDGETGCHLPDYTCPEANKVTYVYTVTNAGGSATDVTVTDNKLGIIGKIPALGAGMSAILTRTACITETTTNVATATADNQPSCSATAQTTVNAVCSDISSEHEGYDQYGYDGYIRD